MNHMLLSSYIANLTFKWKAIMLAFILCAFEKSYLFNKQIILDYNLLLSSTFKLVDVQTDVISGVLFNLK